MTALTTPTGSPPSAFSAEKLPWLLLRLEGLAVFAGAIAAYAYLGGAAWMFIVLLFVPDVSMIGYARNLRLGALTYNLVHNYALALGIFGAAWALNAELGMLLGLILIAHIGLDRMIGYGLKYPTAFKDTHLGRV